MLGRKMILLALVMGSMALWGCNNTGSGGDQSGGGTASATTPGTVTDPTTNTSYALGVDPTTGIARVGSYSCLGCHKADTVNPNAVSRYLQSKHVIHSLTVNAGSPATCRNCHDPIGDGGLVQSRLKTFLADNPAIAAANPNAIPAAGLAAIGCEACHGAGGKHFGATVPIPVAKPDFNACGACHNANTPHLANNLFIGNNLFENFKLSGHLKSIATAGFTSASITAFCGRCHSDEGFRQYASTTTGFDDTALHSALDTLPPLANVSPVQCRTCHESHSGQLRMAATTLSVDDDGNPATANVSKVVFSASFNLCSTCHMNFLTPTWDVATKKFTYKQDPAKVLLLGHTDVFGAVGHFDDPITPAVEGFNINAADEMACLYCHDAHGATKFAQAAAVGFARKWGQTKDFVGDYQGKAFTGQGCIPCHSPLGLVQLAMGVAYAETVTEARVIGCVGCHDLQAKNFAGDAFELGVRRTMPAFAFNYWRADHVKQLQTNPAATLQTVAGLGDNTLCITCHGGRESTFTVDAEIAASAGPYSFLDIHNRAAGATLYGNQARGAYEFTGKVYTSRLKHVVSHDTCIECHDPHSVKLYIKSGAGPAGCNTCHTNITIDPDLDYAGALAQVRKIAMSASYTDYDGDGKMNEGMYYEVKGLQAQLLAALKNYALNTVGHAIQYNANTAPYFFKTGAITYNNRYTDMDATLLRAAYNYHFSRKDPGVYAHNPSYIVAILYDSIEALGGNVSLLTRDSGHRNLGCNSCHIEPYQVKPNPERIQPTKVVFPSGVILKSGTTPFTPFFANDSKLCMTCHKGRAATTTVDARIAAGNFKFVNIDQFAAAASLFGSVVHGGYEYVNGKPYAGQNNYGAHVALGQPSSNYTTCTGCHLNDAAGANFINHDFKPVSAGCLACHDTGLSTSFSTMGFGVGKDYDDINLLKVQLLGLITGSGVTAFPDPPYFSGIASGAQLKACYNWQLADKEPAGYIHNPVYIKQLLWDAIDDLSNHTVPPVAVVEDRP